MKKWCREARAAIEKTVTSFNSLINQLPEDQRGPVAQSRDRVSELLGTLEAGDEEDAATSVNALAGVIGRFHETLAQSTEAYGKLKADHAASLNRVAELEGRITAGDLLPKEKATELAEAAREAGAKEARAEYEVISKRRDAVSQCALPVPADEALRGTDEEFEARRKTAEGRVAELKKAGISMNGVFGALPWAEESVYRREKTLIDEVMKAKPAADPFRAGAAGADRRVTAC